MIKYFIQLVSFSSKLILEFLEKMVIFSGCNAVNLDITDRFESLVTSDILSCVVILYDQIWSKFLVISKNFFAYLFVLVVLVFQLDVVNVFIIPVERELHCV